MATILPFTVRRRSRATLPAAGHGASIIIFPGVRYEQPAKTVKRGDVLAGDGVSGKRKGKS